MMGWDDGGGGWGAWLLMFTMMVLFWGALVVGGIALYRGTRRDDDGGSRPGRRDAETLLDERLARGEIDLDDYRKRRELLRHGG